MGREQTQLWQWSVGLVALPTLGHAAPVINCMDSGPFDIPIRPDGVDEEIGEIDYELDIDCDGDADYSFDVRPTQDSRNIRILGVDTDHQIGTRIEGKTFFVERIGDGVAINGGRINDDDGSSGFFAFEGQEGNLEGWRNNTGFVGVRFPRGGSDHFGWIRMQVNQDFTGVIINYAYESQPGTAITTQIVDNTGSFSGNDIFISKALVGPGGTAVAVPGLEVTYNVDVRNNVGPDDATGIFIEDAPPADLSEVTWTCEAFDGASCPTANGTGAIAETVDLAIGERLRYAMTGTVDLQATGTITNTATATVANDPNEFNNTATIESTVEIRTDIAVTKTNGLDQVLQFDPVEYTIVVSNQGTFDADMVAVTDNIPQGLLNAQWTCSAVDATCQQASGSGSINQTVSINAGGSVTYVLTGNAALNPGETLSNLASASLQGGLVDTDTTNNSASDDTTVVNEIEEIFANGFEQ